MKKLIFLVPFLTFLVSCSFVSKKVTALPLLGGDDLTTDSIVFDKDQNHVTVHIYVDYPVGGNAILVNAIAEYIDEIMGGTYEGDLTNGQEVIAGYGQQEWNHMQDEYREMTADMDPEYISGIGFYSSYEIRKVYETDQVVTYVTDNDTYLGGAHGMQYQTGVTFRKSDGRRFGYDMMRNLGTEAFGQLTKQGLKDYFHEGLSEEVSDEDLKSYLLTEDDVNFLSRPNVEPYMLEEGVLFIYQPYEIAPYAAGMPTYVVSYDKIKPFLTNTAKKMLGK